MAPNLMKVLYIIDNLARGGTELQLTGLIDRLDRRRFTPHICTLREVSPKLLPEDCPHLVYRVPRLFSANGAGAVLHLSRLLKNNNFSVVQTYFQDATVFGGVAAYLAGTPIRLACFRDLGFWRTRGQSLVLRCIYSMMTGFLANANCVRDNFAKHGRINRDSIRVIYNGIDPGSLPWIEHDGPTLHVGLVGNLNRRVKRTDLFLRAAGQVGRKHPQVTWYVIGDGCYRSEYQSLAEKEGIGDRIIFTGNIECVADYLAKFQVGVLCSDSEGVSNALLEYMLCGCASIATRVGGNREVLLDGETGILVAPDSVEALADAILKMIEDIPFRRKLAVAARRDVIARFDWNKCVTAHETIYDSVDRLKCG